MSFKLAISKLEVSALNHVPSIKESDDIAEIILKSMLKDSIELEDNDIVVIAQKIISKAEGCLIDLESITPSSESIKIAEKTAKDPRLVELIIQESKEIIKIEKGLIIVEHRLGHVLANAGIDQSNIDHKPSKETVLLLPKNPNKSAKKIKEYIENQTGKTIGVIITDSIGRAWRLGTIGHAIGASGVKTIVDLRQKGTDLFGRELQTTVIGLADQIASAAMLIMGESNEGKPIVLVKGIDMPSDSDTVDDLIRPKEEDLFR